MPCLMISPSAGDSLLYVDRPNAFLGETASVTVNETRIHCRGFFKHAAVRENHNVKTDGTHAYSCQEDETQYLHNLPRRTVFYRLKLWLIISKQEGT